MVSNKITALEARTTLVLQEAYAGIRDRMSRGFRNASVWNLNEDAVKTLQQDGYHVERISFNNHVVSF